MAEDPTFEDIGIIKTSFEVIGPMINRGDGYFYGAARWSGAHPAGAVFRIAPNQEAEVLYSFSAVQKSTDANYGGSGVGSPLALGSDGAFYGATIGGGAHARGTIYRITVDGAFSVIHDFVESEGLATNNLIVTSKGEIWGTTAYGGGHAGGTLFQVQADGTFKVLYDFYDYWAGSPVPPGYPITLLEGPDGNIYGSTTKGGPLPTEGPQYTYGVFYRYDAPQAVTVLASFGAGVGAPMSVVATSDGFYGGTSTTLIHIDLDGTQTLLWDATGGIAWPNNYQLASLLLRPDGIYGISLYGGPNQSGFVFHYVPGEGTTHLYDFTQDYYSLDRVLIVGNDDLIYGLAVVPEDYSAPSTSTAARRIAAVTAKKSPPPKAHAFRFRAKADQSANFVPVAKPDSAWLPANASFNKQRAVSVDVLANDKDPDKNPLTLTGVVPPDAGYAELVSTAGKLRVHYVTTDPDPASQWLHYHIADGQGGTATGDLIIHSLATGKYAGTATDTSTPPAGPAAATVTIGDKNAITATFVQGKVHYTGKGALGIDETALIPLAAGKNTPLIMHLSLKRGTTRQMTVTVQGGGSAYSAVCPQTAK